MSEADQLLIERYYRNDLSESERQAYEQRLSEDTAFREEARLHIRALQSIELFGRETLKNKLAQRPRSASNRRWFLWLLISLVILGGLWWHFNAQPASSLKNQPPISLPDTNQLKQAPPDLPPDAQKPPVAVQANEKTVAQRLFALRYHPYQDEAVPPSVRTNNAAKDTSRIGVALNTLKQLAAAGHFTESLSTFEKIPPDLQSRPAFIFFKANSLLALGRANEAAPLFESVASHTESAYASHAMWYAGICALNKGDSGQARKWFEKLSNHPDASPAQHNAARNMLRELH